MTAGTGGGALGGRGWDRQRGEVILGGWAMSGVRQPAKDAAAGGKATEHLGEDKQDKQESPPMENTTGTEQNILERASVP
jgi:hypothetical protein